MGRPQHAKTAKAQLAVAFPHGAIGCDFQHRCGQWSLGHQHEELLQKQPIPHQSMSRGQPVSWTYPEAELAAFAKLEH
jgi:hypothetical protein